VLRADRPPAVLVGSLRAARSGGGSSTTLGRRVGQIYNWRTQFNKLSKGQFTVADGTNYAKAESEEVRRLKRRIAELEQERDFLKKATAYFAKADK
jgi:transposase